MGRNSARSISRRKRKQKQSLNRAMRFRHAPLRSRNLRYSCIEITDEPLGDPAIEAIPASELEPIQEKMHLSVLTGKGGDPEEWEAICGRYPHIPTFRNMLYLAYRAAGRDEEAEREAASTCKDFPDYLFGLTNHCLNLLGAGDIEGAERLIDDKFMLDMRYPHRRTFHVSEVVAYTGMIVQYLLAIDKPDVAESQFSVLDELAPDHPMVKALRHRLKNHEMIRLLDRVKSATERYKK